MKKIGFIISKKENEFRRALVLKDIKKIKNKEYCYFESGYGHVLGYDDQELIDLGFKVASEQEIIKECDIICDPKIGDSENLSEIHNKIIFGWIHATLNYNITQIIIENKMTAIAWEKMFKNNKHVFFKNNEIAGEAGVLDGFLKYGMLPDGLSIAILGNGNTSRGAQRILNKLGAKFQVYGRNDEEKFKKNIQNFDVIINCILWDPLRKDHIIYSEDLKKMRKNSLIIDISCDRNGGIETCIPTTIQDPIYIKNSIVHYAVDHTPSLLYKDATMAISSEVIQYVDILIEEQYDEVLNNAIIIEDGLIIDEEINKFQHRN